jgi:drug/metabolite transporter (DMT)-like permease
MKTALLAAVLVALLALAAWGATYVWQGIGDIEMSLEGVLAMIAGVVLCLALGIGLMFLVFYSERRGEEP